MNLIILNGHIGADVQSVTLKNESTAVNFSMATNQFYKDQNGERKSATQWHQIKMYGKLAESAAKILAKGDKVLIHGKLKYDTFKTSEGIEKTLAYIEAESYEKQNPSQKDEQ